MIVAEFAIASKFRLLRLFALPRCLLRLLQLLRFFGCLSLSAATAGNAEHYVEEQYDQKRNRYVPNIDFGKIHLEVHQLLGLFIVLLVWALLS